MTSHGIINAVANALEQSGVDLDTLRATFDRYQEMCANGVDDEFGKDASHLIAYEDGPLG